MYSPYQQMNDLNQPSVTAQQFSHVHSQMHSEGRFFQTTKQ